MRKQFSTVPSLEGIHTNKPFRLLIIGTFDPMRLDKLLSNRESVEIICHAENEAAVVYAQNRSYLLMEVPLEVQMFKNTKRKRALQMVKSCDAIIHDGSCEYVPAYADMFNKVIRR